MKNNIAHSLANAVPASIPATYIATYEILDDPMKLAGFIVLILQGIYVAIKIWRTTKGKDNDD